MTDLPRGTVTFLFTDVEGSTALWERDRTAMRAAVNQHLALLRDVIAVHGGVAFKTVGDAVQAAFVTAPPALAAAVAAQQELQAASWPGETGPLRVRMALHAGLAEPSDGDYLAPCLNRLSRLLATGHGQQVLLTETVRRLLEGELPSGASLRALGSHRLRDLLEPEEVFQVLALGLPEQFPALRALPSHPTNLTVPPTALIGRDQELVAIERLLGHARSRLVTLTGPGGTGKTRLALEVAAEALDRYPDGVFLVDLSLLTDPTLVIPTIAVALGVRETAGELLRETVIRHLQERHLLLVLDNCEQVLESASDIATLLAACPHLSILATSREPLHIRAEREIAVAPLPLPAPGRLPSLAELASVPAVALFVDRAQAASAGFALTPDNAAAVAGICQRLDGLPLAIELAAARIKVLPPAALLTRLEQRLPLLTGGRRDQPPRQRTMRDAIAWSYDLLTTEEQALFRRLAIIAGPFTLAAAEAVAAPEVGLPVFDGIAALIEQSLLRQAAGSDHVPTYVMLEIVREFGLEMLAAVGETEGSRERHARYFLGPDDDPAPFSRLFDAFDAPESLALLTAERDNVRLALNWLDEQGKMDGLFSRTALLYRLWFAPGLFGEGQYWIERALERTSDPAPLVHFRALDAALSLALQRGDYDGADVFMAEYLAIARALGDSYLIGEALTSAGHLAYRQGDYGRAEELLLEAHRLFDERAEHDTEDAIALIILGDTALAQKRFNRAAAWYEQAIAIAETTGNAWDLSDAQEGLGGVKVCTGDLAQAAELYRDSLGRAHDRGHTMLMSSALFGLAALAVASGQSETGAHLLGAAAGLAESLGAPVYPRDMPVRERALAELTAAFGEQRLAAAQQVGRTLTVEEAIGEAKAVAERISPSPP
jgi:predicted ATPase/class 3 adenylate cyclase